MKNRLLLVAIAILSTFNVFAGGKVIESIEFKGAILNYPVKYTVYLPDWVTLSEQLKLKYIKLNMTLSTTAN